MLKTIPELTTDQQKIIGRLLVDTLQGKISEETRYAVGGVVADDFPDPYQHLLSYTQGWVQDNVKLARELRGELRYICEELEDKNK